MRSFITCLCVLALVAPQYSWAASARVEPGPLSPMRGETFSVNIVADMPQPVIGWGLDLTYNHALLSLVGSPTIGPLWSHVSAADGDGLAGLAFPSGISGNNVLLATLTFIAATRGETGLMLSFTPTDKSEGFALDPSGFADLSFQSAHVNVVPEPAACWPLVLGCLAIMKRRCKAKG